MMCQQCLFPKTSTMNGAHGTGVACLVEALVIKRLALRQFELLNPGQRERVRYCKEKGSCEFESEKQRQSCNLGQC